MRIEEVKPKSSFGETVILENQDSQGYASSAQTEELALPSAGTTGTVKTMSSGRKQKYSDHQANCFLKYFYCLALHYFERLKTTDFLEHWAWGCCWNLSSGSHRCSEPATQSPSCHRNGETLTLQRAAQIPVWLNRLEGLLLFVNWKMNLEKQAHWYWNKLWTELYREAFVQTHPWAELVFFIDECTAGQVLSTWLCAHTTI